MVAGRSRDPFPLGNTVALRHGAYSERAIAERAEQVHATLLEVAPWLAEQHFAPAVARYLRAASREALLDNHIAELAAEHGAGKVSSRTWEQATAATRLAAKLGQDLGLDPIGHARLKAVAANASISAATLADLSAEGRAGAVGGRGSTRRHPRRRCRRRGRRIVSATEREKGRRAELEVVALCRAQGWPASRILDQARDGGSDIAGIPSVCLEVKRQEIASVWAWWAQVTAAAKPGEIPVVAFRRSNSDWLALCEFSELLSLLRFRARA